MEINTQLTIAGINIVLPKEDALQIYALLERAYTYNNWREIAIEPLVESNLSISPLPLGFQDDIEAAKLLGEPLNEYRKNKSH